MHPHLFDIPLPWGGSYTIASYGFMIMCGFLACLWLLSRRSRQLGLNPADLFDTALAILVGAIVGARIYYVIYDWDSFSGNLWRIIRIDQGGLVFYGGMMGGTAALFLMMYLRKLPVRRTLGLACSLLPLGHAFGRMGCFLNGCCYGKITNSIVGMQFPKIVVEGESAHSLLNLNGKMIAGSPPFIHHLFAGYVNAADSWSLPVHPTQLYAVGYNLLIFAIVSYVLYNRWRDGEAAWLYGVLYGTARYINEIFRAHPGEDLILGSITAAQVICLILIGLGAFLLGRSRLQPSERPPERGEPPETGPESRGG